MIALNTPDDSGRGVVDVGIAPLSAQQTKLVRSVNEPTAELDGAEILDSVTGRKTVRALASQELETFRTSWEVAPVDCIRRMNHAISQLKDGRRFSRYVEAAVDLEILMDHESRAAREREELVGVPSYLVDGYTDLGIQTCRAPFRRRERIVVDKQRLRLELLSSRRRAIESVREPLEVLLGEIGRSLREDLRYDENVARKRLDVETVELSSLPDERNVNCRHLAILFQLRLQEAGIPSRLVKGRLRLFSFKLRHAWNLAMDGEVVALIDTAFGEDGTPLVVTGGSTEEVYRRASELHRDYCPSPDEFQRYQIRSVGGTGH